MEEKTAGGAEPQKNTLIALAVRDLTRVDKGLAKLAETYGKAVYDVSTTKGMDQAKKARAAIREVRYKVEHIRKDEASRIKAAQTALNNEAARITEAILVIEKPIDEKITAEEDRKKREAEEAARKEQERTSQIRAEIDRLVATPERAVSESLSIAEIQDIITALGSEPLDAEFFKEFLAEAEHTRSKVVEELRTLIARIQLREEEAARLKEQEATLAAQAAEIAALRAQLAAATAAAAPAPVVVEPGPIQNVDGLLLSTHKGEVIYERGVTDAPAPAEFIDQSTGEIITQEVDVAHGMPIDLIDAVESSETGERLFDDEMPSVDRIVLAVSTHFGVDDEAAKRYIIKAGESLSFEAF